MSNYCVRIDPEVRRKSETVFRQFGMYLSDAINIFLRQSIMCNGFPFELKVEPRGMKIEQLPPAPALPEMLEPKPEPKRGRFGHREEYTAAEIEAAMALLKVLKAS